MTTVNPDSINSPAAVWNEPTNIWNFDGSALSAPINAYNRIPDRAAAPDSDLLQPRVVSDPAATESDLITTRTDHVAPIPTAYRPTSGGFSAVRAVRLLEQHRSGFWARDGVVSAVYDTTRADPSKAEIDAMYQNFLLFSYLPTALVPSQDDFASLVTPSKVVTAIQNDLDRLGLDVRGAIPEPTVKVSLASLETQSVGTTGSFDAPLRPYAENLGRLCRHVNGGFAIPRATPVYGT